MRPEISLRLRELESYAEAPSSDLSKKFLLHRGAGGGYSPSTGNAKFRRAKTGILTKVSFLRSCCVYGMFPVNFLTE